MTKNVHKWYILSIKTPDDSTWILARSYTAKCIEDVRKFFKLLFFLHSLPTTPKIDFMLTISIMN